MAPVIDEVKAKALTFPDDVITALDKEGKHATAFRLKVIAFRDITSPDAKPFEISDFFKLPDQRDAFHSFVSTLSASGGGDEPESGLEALAIAMHAPWTTEGDRARHVIVVWTDASAHELGSAAAIPEAYQAQVPESFDKLTDMWHGSQTEALALTHQSERLVMFAPEAYPWSDINNTWDNAILYPSKAGQGLREHELGEIISMIVNSV
jgi:hypothetical protein